jgi:preprotein translocase subunit SecG
MHQLILVFHALVALALIGLVLIQHGKGADVGASFGSGASQTIFGSQGSTSFLVKLTSVLAAIFFSTSLILGYMASYSSKQRKASLLESSAVMQTMPAKAAVSEPVKTEQNGDLPAPTSTQSEDKPAPVKAETKSRPSEGQKHATKKKHKAEITE